MSDKRPYKKHLKPHAYIMQFGESFKTFDLSFIGLIFHESLAPNAEIVLIEHIATKAQAAAKLVYTNLQRFSYWASSEGAEHELNQISAGSPDSELTRWHKAFSSYAMHSIGAGQYIGRDLSACWRGLMNFRDNGLPIPQIEMPQTFASRARGSNSISLRISGDGIQEATHQLTDLAHLMQNTDKTVLAAAIKGISRNPILRNFCEIPRLAAEIQRIRDLPPSRQADE